MPPVHALVMEILLLVLWVLTTAVSRHLTTVQVSIHGILKFYPDDPLWDGQDCCRSERTCCDPLNLPWFCKELLEPTTDDLEVRVCADQSPADEDAPIDLVQLYIQ